MSRNYSPAPLAGKRRDLGGGYGFREREARERELPRPRKRGRWAGPAEDIYGCEVKDLRRYFGKYWCEQCGYEWTSAWAWKDEEQKCGRCREWTAPWALKLVVHEVGAKVKVRQSDLGVVFSIRALAWAGTPPVYDVELVDGKRLAVPHEDIEILCSEPERTNHRSDMCTLCLKLHPHPCSSVLVTSSSLGSRPTIQGIQRGKKVTDMTPYRGRKPSESLYLSSERDLSKELSLDRWFEDGRNDVELWLDGLHDKRKEKAMTRSSKKKKKDRQEDSSHHARRRR